MSKYSSNSKMSTVTKKEIITTVAVRTGVTIDLARKIVEGFLEDITAEIVSGNRLEFRDFGIFEPTTRKGGAPYRNPRTQEVIGVTKPVKTAKFKPSKKLKELLNG